MPLALLGKRFSRSIEVAEKADKISGGWIESHCLHVFMLHAPDFLGFPDAMSMAREHKSWVETGLRMKRLGNRLLAILGGREIHPINVKVGGFYALPDRSDLIALLDDMKWAFDACHRTLEWVSGFPFPDVTLNYEFVALHHPQEYPMNEGRILSNLGLNIQAADYEQHFEEVQVPHSTALQAFHKGFGSYLTGPLARLHLNFSQLPPAVQKAAAVVNFPPSCMNPYRSIQARVLELMLAFQECLRLIPHYQARGEAAADVSPRASVGTAATEAPRGLLYHRYELDDQGLIKEAKIVPPTSQNQRRIEEDLRELLVGQLEQTDDAITQLCEKAIRNYDPCISCATHFLNVKMDRG